MLASEPREENRIMAGGRPTKYKAEHLKVAKAMAKLGATDAELAQALGVALSTVSLWKVTHQEFSDALTISKDVANQRVVDSLFKSATGYSYTEEDVRVVEGKVIKTMVTKHCPPVPTSMIFYLKNRMKAEYRDKHEFEHSGGISVVKIDDTDEAL